MVWFWANITGGAVQKEFEKYDKLKKQFLKNYESPLAKINKESLSQNELMKHYLMRNKTYRAQIEKFDIDYIKAHPPEYYSTVLISKLFKKNKSVHTLKVLLDGLDDDLLEKPEIQEMIGEINLKSKIEIGIDKILANVNPVNYEKDGSFNGKQFKNILSLGSFSDGNICAMDTEKRIHMIDTAGKKLRKIFINCEPKMINKFKASLNGRPKTITTDENNHIFVALNLYKKVKYTYKKRDYKYKVGQGVECQVIDTSGKLIRFFNLEGVISAGNIKVKQGKIYIVDDHKACLVITDAETGKMINKIDGFSNNPGRFDFCINNKNEIVIANPWQQRVQIYSADGKLKTAFGQPGGALDDFPLNGNPLNIACLSTGAVVTSETNFPRIKIYSNEGAREVKGIGHLIEDGKNFPLISDHHDNIYLAVYGKGIFRCIPEN